MAIVKLLESRMTVLIAPQVNVQQTGFPTSKPRQVIKGAVNRVVSGEKPAKKNIISVTRKGPRCRGCPAFVLLLKVLKLMGYGGRPVVCVSDKVDLLGVIAVCFFSDDGAFSAKFSVGGGEGVCHSRPVCAPWIRAGPPARIASTR